MIFQALQSNKLALKRSKCHFGETYVAYLGHIISGDGIAMNPEVAAVLSSPRPWYVSLVRISRFDGYYHKFIKDYGTVASPLAKLLKEEFVWSTEATDAFQALQVALTSAPILQLPDLTKRCVVD